MRERERERERKRRLELLVASSGTGAVRSKLLAQAHDGALAYQAKGRQTTPAPPPARSPQHPQPTLPSPPCWCLMESLWAAMMWTPILAAANRESDLRNFHELSKITNGHGKLVLEGVHSHLSVAVSS